MSPMANMHTPSAKQESVGISGRALPMIMVGQATPSNFMTGVEVVTANGLDRANMVHMQAHNGHHSVSRMYGIDHFAMSGGYPGNEQ